MRRIAVTKAEREWLRRRKSEWKLQRGVRVGQPSGFPMGSDADLWWRMTLYLHCNRHCAECWTDDEVSAALHQLARERGYEDE